MHLGVFRHRPRHAFFISPDPVHRTSLPDFTIRKYHIGGTEKQAKEIGSQGPAAADSANAIKRFSKVENSLSQPETKFMGIV